MSDLTDPRFDRLVFLQSSSKNCLLYEIDGISV